MAAQMNTEDTALNEISQGWNVILHSLIPVWNQKTSPGVEIRIVATRGRGVEGWWSGKWEHVGQRAQGCS